MYTATIASLVKESIILQRNSFVMKPNHDCGMSPLAIHDYVILIPYRPGDMNRAFAYFTKL